MTVDEPVLPGSPALEKAIDRVEAERGGAQAITLLLTPQALGLGLPGGALELRFTQPEGLEAPRMFVLDIGLRSWTPVVLAPGRWQLRPAPDDSAPGLEPPKLWVPPS